MREDGNCIQCGPVTKKQLKARIDELSERNSIISAHAVKLQRRLDEIVKVLEPGPMPVLEKFQFNLHPAGDFKYAHGQWTQRRHLHETIKAIAEGKE